MRFTSSLCLGLILLARSAAAGADTFIWAVQLSAVVQTSPPRITLNWEADDPYDPTNYTIFRKAKGDVSWGSSIATLDGSASTFTDSAVSVGSAYEYQVIKHDAPGYVGYGYIYAGIQAPLLESRGTLLLIVETNVTAGLASELARLQSDLVGDGWQVHYHGVSSNNTPDSVHSLITADYYADPANVNTVFLLGHVPVLESGDLNYDGHEFRPMPADAYYGDVLNDWPTGGDPTQRPDYLPSYVPLMIGRVDFFDMPGLTAPVPWPDEPGLLQRYLNKDHAWRMKQLTVRRRALMGDARGGGDGDLATAASGYRNFDAFVGPGNTDQANTEYGAPYDERWITLLGEGSYLWAYGNGGGAPNGVSGLGTNVIAGTDNFLFSTDVVGVDAKAVFVMLFGSWFAEWDLEDDFMRSFLATPTTGLACVESGEPHWFFHHMALGETIGYSTRLTLNNSTLYQNQENSFTQAVYIALMGDPTLRLEPVAPPGGLSANPGASSVTLNWTPSSDSVAGYYVYRAGSPGGPFTRVTPSLLSSTSFTDSSLPANTYTYMVRAVLLENNFSGSYYNPSQGSFVTATVGFGAPPSPVIYARVVSNGLMLTWSAQPNVFYHVEARNSLYQNGWVPCSPSLNTNGQILSWTDTSFPTGARRFYRVVSP